MPDHTDSETEAVEQLIDAGTEIAGGAAGGALGFLVGGPVGAVVGGAGGPLLAHTVRHLASEIRHRVLGAREEVRIGAALAFAGEKIRENTAKGQRVRRDGFFTEQPGERAAAQEIFEGVLLAAQREHQEKKLRFYGNLVANIAFHPEISREHANLLIKLGQNMSYRQMCLLALFALRDRLTLRLRDGDYRGGGLSGHNRIALVQEAYDLYLQSMVSGGGEAWIGLTDVNPSKAEVQGTGATLYNLMELWSIVPNDLDEIASLLR